MSRYKSKNDELTFNFGRGRSNRFQWVFIAILVFVIIIVPIYGITLRYDVSIMVRFVFSTMGDICLTIGILVTFFTVIFSLFSKHIFFKSFILGIVLIWIGAFLTDTQFNIFGYLFGHNSPPQGYY